jgi:hypothetical protein
MRTNLNAAALIVCSGLLSGCAGSSDVVQTSSVDPNAAKMAAAAAKPDPTCVALLTKIDGIRKEGVTERAEQAGQGKSTTVPVKRASLAQLAELSKANSEYQSKCSAPGLKSAYVPPVVAPVAAAPVVEKPAAKKVVAKPAPKPVAAVTAPAPAPVAAATATAVAPVAVAVPTPVTAIAPAAPAAPVAAQAAATVAPAAVAAASGNASAAAIDAAKKVATQAATSAVTNQVAPLPAIPGVSVAQ